MHLRNVAEAKAHMSDLLEIAKNYVALLEQCAHKDFQDGKLKNYSEKIRTLSHVVSIISNVESQL